jgi:uncharacterized membrane protein YoaK (UPF0700 family)
MNETRDLRDDNRGSARASDSDDRTREFLLIGLTFAAGVVDAVSYLGLGNIFTANMTGNVVFLALAVGERSLPTALHSVGALIGFCLGAVFAGQILGRAKPSVPWPPRVTWVLLGELAFMVAFGLGWVLLAGRPDGAALYLLIGLSSFGMGMQNAAARHLAVPALTTTVMTMALTGFMVDLPAVGLSTPTQRRGALAVVALFSGAAVGGTLMVFARTIPPFLTIGAILGVAGIAYLRFGRPAAAGAES